MYDVFISSPVDDFSAYREGARKAAAVSGPAFNIFLYEQHRHSKGQGLTTTERILSTFGKKCDIFIIFFQDRLGEGTLQEFEHFETHFRASNPDCALFWAKIDGPSNQKINAFIDRLVAYEPVGMIPIDGALTIKSPEELMCTIVKSLAQYAFEKSQQMKNSEVRKFY